MIATEQHALKTSGLRRVSDDQPGITRTRHGKGFSYKNPQGKAITDDAELARIRALAIPPAYRDVWISPWPNGHLQATGIDARGRKQYRYHPRWRELRDAHKYHHVVRFVEFLPLIRERINHDLGLRGMPKNKVLAAMVHLLDTTLIRVGNAEYARENKSYGLATIRENHVRVDGSVIRFHFKGKSNQEWNRSLRDRRIAAIVKKCAALPGVELFKYQDEQGNTHDVTSVDVNAYLGAITSEHFTAKDFRTWAGTVLAAMALVEFEKYDSAAQAKKNVVRAIESVAGKLGNTPAVCRKCYIHPEVLNSYLDDALAEMIEQQIDRELKSAGEQLSADELMVLAFLKKRLESR